MQGLIFGFIVSYIFLKVSIPFLLIHAPDKPNKRSSHTTIKASSGGISFIFSTLLFAFLQNDIQWFMCLPLAVIGIIDDRVKLSAKLRYLAQLLTVILILKNTLFLNEQLITFQDYFIFIFLLIFGTAIINFSNFMDGIDGLLAGCFFLIIIFASLTFNLTLFSLCGSLLAFLIFNWQPAKVFMGDVGSTFLGALLVLILYNQATIYDSFRNLLIALPIFSDALVTVLRRFYLRQNIFKAHKSHLFQRLHQSGWSHSKISAIYIFLTCLMFFSVYINQISIMILSSIISIFVGTILELKFAAPFKESI